MNANANLTPDIPRSFYILTIAALIWNALGVANFVVQMLATDLSAFPDWWRAVVESRPLWASAAMAVAVFGGALGCLLLLMRRAAAPIVLIASLVGVLVTMSHALGVGAPGARQILEAVVMPVLIGIYMVWYARRAAQRGWLN